MHGVGTLYTSCGVHGEGICLCVALDEGVIGHGHGLEGIKRG